MSSECGRFKLAEERLFSHSPSFSLCSLLFSKEDFAFASGASSIGSLTESRGTLNACGLGVPMLIMDEMLLFSEWPRIVDNELSVSDEIVDSGRGMIVTLSSKPTRGRDGGRVGRSSSGGPNGSDISRSTFEIELERGGECDGCSRGVVGRLWLKRGEASVGFMMLLTS